MIMLREIKYTLKNTFRDKSFVFWTIMYPIILASFFYLAFGSVMEGKEIQFSVGISAENEMKEFLKEIDILEVKEYSPEEAEQAMRDKEISAYITNDMTVQVIGSGVGQTTTQNIITGFKRFFYIFENGGNPETIDFEKEYFKVREQSASPYILMFYTLIGMVSFYGYFGGLQVLESFQANVSELGKRMSVSPIKKGGYILNGLLVMILLNLLSNFLLVAFIRYGLKIELFKDYLASFGLILAGNLVGITMGVWTGSNSKLTPPIRMAVGIGVPLVLSSLAGMASPNIKTMIMRHAPLLDQLNPISIITSGLYRINLLGNQNYYGRGILILLGVSAVFVLLSLQSLRRKRYDSF